MKTPRLFRPLAAALALTLIPLQAVQAQLSASSARVETGAPLTISLNIPAARQDSAYFAALVGGALYFFDEQGAPSPYRPGVPTPRRLAPGVQGGHTLLALNVPAGLAGSVAFYAAFGQAGVDILSTPGALDTGTLQQVQVEIAAASGGAASGRALYQEHCAACHSANPLHNVDHILRGRDAAVTQRAIEGNRGGMGYLSFLSASQHAGIAAWIANPQ